MFTFIDRISDLFGRIAAWLFFLIGGIIVFEVIARYVFLAPTIWGEEMSRFLQIWATYLAAAYVLKNRQLIAIDVVVDKMPELFRIICESCALLVIAIFSLVAFVYGFEIAFESIRIGRATSTMLAVPKWMTEISIPIGFGLMLLQTAVELVRTITRSGDLNSKAH
jgi:TRAP-type C4-dicarboxylate transport system permease small subunit